MSVSKIFLYTTTLSLLYHHYHPTVSFCQLLLNKTPNYDIQIIYMYNYHFSPLLQLPSHTLILPTAPQQTHPMLVYIYNYTYNCTFSPLPPLPAHNLILPFVTQQTRPILVYIKIFIYNYPISFLPPLRPHKLILLFGKQETHPMLA